MIWSRFDAQAVPRGQSAKKAVTHGGGFPGGDLEKSGVDHRESAKLNALWAARDSYKAVSFPFTRKLWAAVTPDDTGVIGVGFVALLVTPLSLAADLLGAPLHLLRGVKNAADAALHGALSLWK
jgi:hypothetical protein